VLQQPLITVEKQHDALLRLPLITAEKVPHAVFETPLIMLELQLFVSLQEPVIIELNEQNALLQVPEPINDQKLAKFLYPLLIVAIL
jgi:hypothetical protein